MSRICYMGMLFLLAAGTMGCAARSQHDRDSVSKQMEQTTGHGLPALGKAGEVRIPPGINTAELSADDAVAIALWNNAAFQTDLTELGFTRAELLQAGLLKNPLFSVFFPIGPKQLEFTLTAPFEALWQRPRRIAIAKLNAEAMAARLVQHGLNLAGEAKIAHAEVEMAQKRVGMTKEMADLSRQIAEIAEARLRAGDISELDAAAARTNAVRAQQESARASRESGVALERLRALLGLSLWDAQLGIRPSPVLSTAHSDVDVRGLVTQALAARPDLRAAEMNLEAAGKRVGLEKAQIITLAGMLDANAQGKEGFEAGPGLALPLPFFDANQAGVARARAEMDRAAQRYVEVQQRIASEVREAYVRLRQASEEQETWRGKVIPAVEERLKGAEKSYQAGEISYLFLLEVSRELLEARLREAELQADVRRAAARLEQSVGKKL